MESQVNYNVEKSILDGLYLVLNTGKNLVAVKIEGKVEEEVYLTRWFYGGKNDYNGGKNDYNSMLCFMSLKTIKQCRLFDCRDQAFMFLKYQEGEAHG